MKKHYDTSAKKVNGQKPFSLLTLIRLKERIFLSSERSKLCFELLEMNSAAQNNLPRQRLENILRSRCFIRF
jgi:hypothetical protein